MLLSPRMFLHRNDRRLNAWGGESFGDLRPVRAETRSLGPNDILILLATRTANKFFFVMLQAHRVRF